MPEQAQTKGRTPTQYQDFILRFSGWDAAASTYRVWVEGQAPGGAMQPDAADVVNYNPGLFWDDPVAHRGGVMQQLERRKLDENGLYQLGYTLADLALPPASPGLVRKLFQQSQAAVSAQEGQGLRLRLHIDIPELAQLPWELMAQQQASGKPTPSDFFALRRSLSIVRTASIWEIPRRVPRHKGIRVAGVLSSPDDQDDLKVDKDQEAIESAVKTLNAALKKPLVETAWISRPATRAALDTLLKDGADVFHFAGHGRYDLPSGKGLLLLEDKNSNTDEYPGEALAQLLGADGAGVRLVVLGACESGRQDGLNQWSGVATALAHQRVPAVIASQFNLGDKSAALLAAQVYARILSGYSVDEALFEGRTVIYQQSDLQQRYWAAPVLYLQEQSGVLFPKPAPGTKGEDDALVEVYQSDFVVAGENIGADIDVLTGGKVVSEQKDFRVSSGGKNAGVHLGRLGPKDDA